MPLPDLPRPCLFLLRVALAVVVWAVTEPLLLDGTASTGEALAFGLGLTLPLLAVRRFPIAVGVTVVAVYLAQYTLGARMEGAMSPELALAFGLFGIAAYAPAGSRRPWAGVPLAAAVPAGLWFASRNDLGDLTEISSSQYLYITAVAIAGVLPGLALRSRREEVAGLEAEVTTLLTRTPLAVDRAVEDERAELGRRTAAVVSGLVADLSALVRESRVALSESTGRAAGVGRRMVDAAGTAGAELRTLLGTLHAPAGKPDTAPRTTPDWRALAGLAFPSLGLAVLGVAVRADLPHLPVTLDFGTGPLRFGAPVIGGAGALVLTLLTPVGLLLRRRAPLAGVAMVGGFLLAGEALRVYSSLTITPVFTCGVLAYVSGAWSRSRGEAVAAGAVTLTTAGLFWRFEQYHFGPVEYGYMVAVLIGTWAVGRQMRADLRDALVLRDRARVLRVQRDRLCDAAVRGERLDLARELHDVVGHALSLIAVQSGVVSVLADRDPDRAGAALTVIDDAARTVAAEVAGLQHALGGAELEQVVADARAADQVVTLRADPELDALPEELRGTVTRIVREALTNARKHASGAPVEVTVAVGDGVGIEVRNAPGRPLATAPTGSGLGVPGMVERAEALDGTLSAGPDGAGGWSVRAWLPPAGDRELAVSRG